MPTAGTHITIVQRLALNPRLQPLLGNPDPEAADPNSQKFDPNGVIRMKFANLGAVGPDIFYAMADYGADLQDFENFLVKVGGTFECMSELMEQIGTYIDGTLSEITNDVTDSLSETTGLLTGVIKQSILGLIVKAGYNFWPAFESRRQQDRPRKEWFWADYLHYVRTGKFVRQLLEVSKQQLDAEPDNTQYQNLYAYALGYLTHYIVDVVGHPYVNQVVQAPWRLYWQRHHLVENFIDVYVWDRWHTPMPAPAPPTTTEQPLDAVTSTPNAMGTGAPFTFARLHDHIAIGISTLGDPVDTMIEQICEKINNGLFDMGIAEETESPEPTDADFQAWTKLMVNALKAVYPVQDPHPLNLANSKLGLGRTDGYPLEEDVAAAYGIMRLLLKVSTEEKIREPAAPDITTDISSTVEQLGKDIQDNLNNLPTPPPISTSGNVSLESLLDAVASAAEYAAEVAEAVEQAVMDFVKDAINLGGTAVTDAIKYALYLLNKALFTLYRQLRDVMVLAANAMPFTDELEVNKGGLNTNSLWRSIGNLGPDMYPREELVITLANGQMIAPEREFVHPRLAPYPAYAPFIPPTALGAGVEMPAADLTAPYTPTSGATLTIPDDFIDAPRGDNMFAQSGAQPTAGSTDPRARGTFAALPRNFGGAMDNCTFAILNWMDLAFELPDYNLDGDRGYAWPCWDVEGHHSDVPDYAENDPAYAVAVPTPLNPTDWRNAPGIAHVNAELAH